MANILTVRPVFSFDSAQVADIIKIAKKTALSDTEVLAPIEIAIFVA